MKVNPFVMLDIETLGTPEDCGTSHIAMPSFSFVHFIDKDTLPTILHGQLQVQPQLNLGAKVSASTIAFWMGEAAKETKPSESFQGALTSDASLVQFHRHKETDWVKLSTADNANLSILNRVNTIINRLGIDDLQFFGNGPEFDMSIYSAVSCAANKGSAVVPWKYWNLGNVRTLRSLYEQSGLRYKHLTSLATAWATSVMKDYDTSNYGIHAEKHDPTFDALVESYCVAQILELVKL